MRLPVEATAPAAETASPAAPPVAEGPAGASLVLVIDDDPGVRELMGRYLTREGFRVAVASSGDEGLRLARELRPDAITLDVMMPGLDGWAVLGALKADAATADIPVVMLTIVDDRNLGYALGAAEYLTKPIDRERLLAVLARYRRDRPVLIVEDDAPLRELLRRMLEREGYTVVEAEHGRAALDRLREGAPGVILLDLMMPVMDGFEFLAELRRGGCVARNSRDRADGERPLHGGARAAQRVGGADPPEGGVRPGGAAGRGATPGGRLGRATGGPAARSLRETVSSARHIRRRRPKRSRGSLIEEDADGPDPRRLAHARDGAAVQPPRAGPPPGGRGAARVRGQAANTAGGSSRKLRDTHRRARRCIVNIGRGSRPTGASVRVVIGRSNRPPACW